MSSRTQTRQRRNNRQATATPKAAAAVKAPIPQQPDLRPVVDLTKCKPVRLTKTPRPTVVVDEKPIYLDLRAEAAAAALYAGVLGIPAWADWWTGMSTGEATCLIDPTDHIGRHRPDPDKTDNVRLTYAPHPHRITASQLCIHARWHHATIDSEGDITEFVETVAACEDHNPRALRAQALGKGVHRASASTADTQAIPTLKPEDLPQRHAADSDQPKEHPES